MLIDDYQWPSMFTRFTAVNNRPNQSLVKIKNKIESYFSEYYGCYVCLVPSARSAISILIKYKGLTRKDTVYINKWSSMCLYSVIGPYCNISTDFINPDLILANHKWGYKSASYKNFNNKLIIEDSVDTIHLSQKSTFPNGGFAEIVSLPKVIGSFSGGLILTKDHELVDYINSKQFNNMDLATIQTNAKINQLSSKNLAGYDWSCYEYKNTSLDLKMLVNINAELNNFTLNSNIITSRREVVHKKFPELRIDTDRVGPVVVFPKSHYMLTKNCAHFMVRQFNSSSDVNKDMYLPSYLLPIHFRIENDIFYGLLNSIERID